MFRGIESWPDWKIAVVLTGALRVFYSAFAGVLSFVIDPDPALIRSNALTGHLPLRGSLYYALLGIWERFDTLWYLRIAEHGYDLPAAVVFHPLYPALVRLISPVTGMIAAALLISTVATGFLFTGILQLARMELSDAVRFRAIILLTVWPTSFIFFAGYTDALAAALVVWCIVLARSQRWLMAAVLACAAGLSRSMGALLIAPLAVMAWRPRRQSAWPVLLAPSGTIAYWAWLRASGRPGVVEAYRRFWSTEVAAPWTTLWHAVHQFSLHPDVLLAFSLIALTLFTLAGISALRRPEDRFFIAAMVGHILLRLCLPPLLGAQRYLLPAYPSFLTFGEKLRTMRQSHFLLLCGSIFALNLAWMYAFLNWSLVL